MEFVFHECPAIELPFAAVLCISLRLQAFRDGVLPAGVHAAVHAPHTLRVVEVEPEDLLPPGHERAFGCCAVRRGAGGRAKQVPRATLCCCLQSSGV